MKHAIVFSQPRCPGCVTAKTTLAIAGYTVEERELGNGWTKSQLLEIFPDARSVPQVIINNVPVGSLANVLNYLEAKKL